MKNAWFRIAAAAWSAAFAAGVAPFPVNAAVAPMMAVSVPPPAQVIGLNSQVENGLGATWTGFESTRDTRRSGTTDIDNPDHEKNVNWRQELLLDYNVYHDFTAILGIPYVYNHVSYTGYDHSASGIGDLALFGKYALYKDQMFNARREVDGLLGLEFPTGATHARDAQGQLVSATEQAGSGTTNVTFGGAYVYGFPYFSLYGDATYKIYTHASYSFGNVAEARSGVNAPLPFYQPLSVTCEVLGQFVARDRSYVINSGVLPDGKVESSGSDTIFIAPGFQWAFLPSWNVSASFQVPVYQNLRGTQLKSDVNVVLALSTRIGGSKPPKKGE